MCDGDELDVDEEDTDPGDPADRMMLFCCDTCQTAVVLELTEQDFRDQGEEFTGEQRLKIERFAAAHPGHETWVSSARFDRAALLAFAKRMRATN